MRPYHCWVQWGHCLPLSGHYILLMQLKISLAFFFLTTISQLSPVELVTNKIPRSFFLMNGCQVRFFVIMRVVLYWANRMELPSFFFFLLNLSLLFLSSSILLLALPKALSEPLEPGGIRPVDLAAKEGNPLVFYLPNWFLPYAWARTHAYSWIIWFLFLANALVVCYTTNNWAALLAQSSWACAYTCVSDDKLWPVVSGQLLPTFVPTLVSCLLFQRSRHWCQ